MWLRVDDKFPDHPKARGLDAVAIAVWLAAACWSAEYEQDGRVTPEAARQLAARFDSQVSLLGGEEPPVVARLVAVGLWERHNDIYVIHDFLDYNPSRREVARERRAARARGRKARLAQVSAGRRSGEVRANVTRTLRVPPVPVPARIPSPEIQTRRTADRSALQMAQDAQDLAVGETATRLVQAASERFEWRLTKTKRADEWRLAGELLEHWDEATILRAIAQRRKLSSMRWLAEFIPQLLAQAEAPPKQRAWLDDPDTRAAPAHSEAEAPPARSEDVLAAQEAIRRLAAAKAMP